MGEKGIGGGAIGSLPDTSSLVEKTTTSVVTSVTEIGTDLATTVQEQAIGAIAEETVRAARERLSSPDDGTNEPPTAAGLAEPPKQ